jgi:cob(I)alamin adenosyltransferase
MSLDAMNLYTRTGDDGSTQLGDGSRVRKDDPRLVALGTLDELNAHLGLAAVACADASLLEQIRQVQRELFGIGSLLAQPSGESPGGITREDIQRLEGWIDESQARLPSLDRFILPGESELGARLHVARTVCRRAERAVIALALPDRVPQEAIVYLNRLADLLFSWARLGDHLAGRQDVPWREP